MLSALVIFALTLISGAPIAIALGLAGLAGRVELGIPLRSLSGAMFAGMDSFILLAAPFYLLAGDLMHKAGVTGRLIDLASIVTRAVRGGTAYAVVLGALLFSGISGAAVADAAVLGQLFGRRMPAEGYGREYTAALIASASLLGPIIPPSIIMVIYGLMANVPVIDLFLGGVLPGIVLALALCFVIGLHSVRGAGLPRPQSTAHGRSIGQTLLDTLLVLLLPIALFRGAIAGVFTVTEAGGVAVAYALLLGFVIYRTLDLKEFYASLVTTARLSASIYIILGASNILAQVMAIGGLAGFIADVVALFIGSSLLFLFVAVVLLLVVGLALEPGPAIVLLVPIFQPIVTQLGIDPLHFGIVMIFALTVGLVTPPVGLCVFVVAQLLQVPSGRVIASMTPFFLAVLVALAVVMLVPGLSTWLPIALK
ncbi:TRAP transporter large permease [Bosea vestrisii]|uniref:TRAP transporter large permease n=1 Tax=Bosea vestrisii TaxID=151416 RepID=UPI0024DF6D3E|nr:TRAP transporter large permease [Bosea vestrisii]WID95110.1 TRAP transporter large permease [Bosea vestrisii]